MKIKLKTRAAGHICGAPGDVIEVDHKAGEILVSGGYASAVEIPKPVSKVETATAEPEAEIAAQKPLTRRRGYRK